MSEPGPSGGLQLLRQRVAMLPDALRRSGAGPDPALGPGGEAGFVATGVGSSAAHARFLVHLLGHGLGLRARFASPGEFVAEPPPRAREETLVVFSQGLSPNARFALAHAGAFGRVVLVTSTPKDGGTRDDAAEKRLLLASLEAAGACIVCLPGADEYGTLLRVVGPMLGYMAALRIARSLGGPPIALERICAAVSEAPGRLGRFLPEADASIVLLGLGATVELAENLRFKILEGLRRPAPPIWDLLHLAHGPWQELHERNALLLALTHAGVDPERRVLAEVEALLVPGRHRLLRLEATLPSPLSIFEHEALLNELVLRGIEAGGPDPARWPGDAGESGLYRMLPDTAPSRPVERRSLAEQTWPEIERLLAAGPSTAVIPLGATEQHGPHLPLDTDTRIAEALAERFCREVPEAVRLPALWAGRSREHLAFPGTLDLRAETLEAVLIDLVDALARHGFSNVFVFSAHGGNDVSLRAMLPRLRAVARPARLIAFTGLAMVAASQERLSAEAGVDAAACGQHGGEHETSILLGLAPAAVRTGALELGHLDLAGAGQALFQPSLRAPVPNGVVGDPRSASGARAERYLAGWTALLVAAYRAEKNAK